MDFFDVYVLTRLVIDEDDNVTAKNEDVTFDIHEAEAHKAKGVENDFETFAVAAEWRDDAEQTALVKGIRAFREYVDELRAEALR